EAIEPLSGFQWPTGQPCPGKARRIGPERGGVGIDAAPKPFVTFDNMSLRRRPLKKSAASGQVV
ncbi:MAG: hypothetical protein ACTSSR_01735, partial [Alphaproteobacteria bacterium]